MHCWNVDWSPQLTLLKNLYNQGQTTHLLKSFVSSTPVTCSRHASQSHYVLPTTLMLLHGQCWVRWFPSGTANTNPFSPVCVISLPIPPHRAQAPSKWWFDSNRGPVTRTAVHACRARCLTAVNRKLRVRFAAVAKVQGRNGGEQWRKHNRPGVFW